MRFTDWKPVRLPGNLPAAENTADGDAHTPEYGRAGSRYTFRSASPGSANVTVSDNTASASITRETREGIADYLYGISRWDETSHLDAVINRIEYRRS